MEDLLEGKSFDAEIDEQIVFNQLYGNANAVWRLLLATGYLKVLKTEKVRAEDEDEACYTLALTNSEVRKMFQNMVKGWFENGDTEIYYNEFIHALLNDYVRKMNTFTMDLC